MKNNKPLSQLVQIVIIVPCYNEEASLPLLWKSLKPVIKSLDQYSFHLLLVNDGSTDGSQKIIDSMAKKDSRIHYIEFANNAGHQSALRAGINVSSAYDCAIMMDADLQHPPEMIPKMIQAWLKSSKIVQMVRNDSLKDTGFIKYATSKGYYWFINKISDLGLVYGASDFRLIDKSIIDIVVNSTENDLFLRGYFSWLKVNKTSIEYKPNERVAGTSKYTFRKMIDLAANGVLQFSEKPLQIAVSVGLVMALLSFLYGLVLILLYLLGDYTVSGWTSLMLVILFCFGVNFIILGIMGTYLAHSIRIQKQRPEYIIQSKKLPNM